MDVKEKRLRLKKVLEGTRCIHPTSVYDPFSARMADSLGAEIGMLAGSVASAVVLGGPDNVTITLTEFADLARRITRASNISLMVDADHGYGNAFNAMRTVEELETAGVAGMTIEDTLLPEPFRKQKGQDLIPVDEGVGKLKAALAGRKDPSLVVFGRTSAVGLAGIDEAVKRVKAYSQVGVDGIFLAGVTKVSELEALHAATSLPLLLGSAPTALRPAMAPNGVRIALAGHYPFWSSVKTAYDTMKFLVEGGSPDDLKSRAASAELTSLVTHEADYARWKKEFLG